MTEKTDTPAADDFDAAFAEAVQGLATAEVTTTDSTPAGKAAASAAAEDTAADDKAAEAAKAAADKQAATDAEAKATADAEAKAAADKQVANKQAADKAEADRVAAGKAEETRRAGLTDEQRAAEDKAKEKAEAERVAAEKAAQEKATEEAAHRRAEEAARRIAKEAEERAAREAAEKEAAEKRKIIIPELSKEDDALLKKFAEDWPEQATAVNKVIEHKVAVLEARFAQALVDVIGKVYKDIEPLVQTTSTLESTSYRAAVLKIHSDFDAVVDKLEPWIKGQPAYLQESMMRVYNDGTAQELIDLVGRYKKEAGVETKVPAAQPSIEDKAKDTKQAERAAAAAAKAAALAPVSGKRTAPNPTGTDPNNFDDAFAEAAALYSTPAK